MPPDTDKLQRMSSMSSVDRRAWRALFAAQLGWILDAMDFLIFIVAIVPIQKEFGLSKPMVGMLLAVGLAAAAIGGVAFGPIADRVGRVRALSLSILLYSLATAGLATSNALWHLIVWRVVVGLGMGGEWSCGSVLVAETWPAEHRGKAIGIMQSGWAVGALLAYGLSALFLVRLGWRVLFLIGALPAIAAFVIRRKVEEPPVWRERKAEKSDWFEMFRRPFTRQTVVVTAVASSVLLAYWGVTSWLPTFLATPVAEGGAGLTVTKGSSWLVVLQVGAFAGYVSFGWFADRIGRRPAFTLFMVAATALVPLFAFYARTPALLLVIGLPVGYFMHGYFSIFGAMLAELFPTRIRATAQGFCYNIGRLFSALAPFGIGTFAQRYGFATVIAMASMFFALGGTLIWLLPETRGAEL